MSYNILFYDVLDFDIQENNNFKTFQTVTLKFSYINVYPQGSALLHQSE